MYEFTHSEHLEFKRSRMRERVYKHPPPMLLRQILQQQKLWPGMRSYWRERNTMLSYADYTYENFASLRKRYAHRDVVFTGEGFAPPFDPVSYSATDTISNLGDGNTPATTGYPASFTLGVPTGDDQTFNKSAPLLAPGSQTLTFTSDTAFEMAETFGRNSTTVELSEEVLFKPYLLEMATRLQARTFAETGDVLWSPRDYFDPAEYPDGPFAPKIGEAYKEWYGGYDANIAEPDDISYFTGATTRTDANGNSVDTAGATRLSAALAMDIDTRPFQGSASEPLHSFWVYPEYLEFSNEVEYELRIIAFRTRFKLSHYTESVPYFMARGIVYVDTARIPTEPSIVLRLHPVVQLLSEGTLAPDTPLEIPLPYGPTDEWKDFMQIGPNHLSCGAVTFCILKEGKVDWSTRTGVKLVGTADSLVTTVDDDDTTVDTDLPI